MATVTGLTAERMAEIEAASVVDGEIVDGDLILTKHDGTTINAGPVEGPAGPPGPAGSSAIPGEIKMWPNSVLPDLATFGKWVWANGDPFDVATYPVAAANISSVWKTAHGQADPGAGKFRVPDLRGMVPACLDALPIGSTRANRTTRTAAITMAQKTGEETHRLAKSELAKHNHGGSVSVAGSISGTATAAGAHYHTPATPGDVFQLSTAGQEISFQSGGNIDERTTGLDSQTSTVPAHTHPLSGTFSGSGGVAEDGSDGFHETMQPTVHVPYIVFLG